MNAAPVDLDKLEALEKAATSGVWSVWQCDDPRLRFLSDGNGNIADEIGPDDAEFLAALRNVAPVLFAELRAAWERIAALEAVTIEDKTLPVCLPWTSHEGPPHMTPQRALEIYRAKGSEGLGRTEMTDEQRANFVGDSKPT